MSDVIAKSITDKEEGPRSVVPASKPIQRTSEPVAEVVKNSARSVVNMADLFERALAEGRAAAVRNVTSARNGEVKSR